MLVHDACLPKAKLLNQLDNVVLYTLNKNMTCLQGPGEQTCQIIALPQSQNL